MWNKRGVSGVVATVLVVLITIAAAAILFSTIIPFVKNSLSSTTECLPYNAYLEFAEELEYTCYDADNLTGFSIRVNAPSGDSTALDRFDVVFSTSGSLRKASITNQTTASIATEGVRMLDKTEVILSVPKIGEVMTYVYNAGPIRPEVIEVYPVLKSGKICDKSDEIKLMPCREVILR